MTEFEKQTYKDMSRADRVSIWMIKASEFFEFSRLMTNEDAKFLKKVLDAMIYEEQRLDFLNTVGEGPAGYDGWTAYRCRPEEGG